MRRVRDGEGLGRGSVKVRWCKGVTLELKDNASLDMKHQNLKLDMKLGQEASRDRASRGGAWI